MKASRQAISVAEAQHRIRSCIRTLPVEPVHLTASFGRRLAEDVHAAHPLPHFVRAAMDGFAVRFEDIKEASPDRPVCLEVAQTVQAGTMPALPVLPGQAARIMTGAAVPAGADALVVLEQTEDLLLDGKPAVAVRQPSSPGKHLAPAGSEIQTGERLLEAGRRILPGEMAVLAAFGYEEVKVYSKPKVGIFSTGSELLSLSAPLQSGKIRNSNSYMIAAQVTAAGGEPVLFPAVPDEVRMARRLIYSAIEDVDLVITTGGVSVGDYDIMAVIFNELGGELLFNKVAMRPGSPTTAGRLGDKLLFGLSGNPGACFVGFELFARPVLNGMQGKREIFLPRFQAAFDGSFSRNGSYERFVRGTVNVADGQIRVKPLAKDQSSMLISIKDAGCLIHIPAESPALEPGDRVNAFQLNTME